MDFGIVIVIYNPDEKLFDSKIELLLKENTDLKIIIVDNSEKDTSFLNKYKTNNNLFYLDMGCNVGIARAQNEGVRYLKNRDFNFDGFIFFDQDSNFSIKLITDIVSGYNKIKLKEKKVGIVSPSILEVGEEITYDKLEYSNVNEVISSGSLVNNEIFKNNIFMNEDLFIDYVDFDFCWRVLEAGNKIYKLNNVIMIHKVGQKKIKIFNKYFYVPAPIRHFYQYRNGKFLLKKDYVPKYWKKRERILRIITPFIIIFVCDNKIERLKEMYRGIKNDIR